MTESLYLPATTTANGDGVSELRTFLFADVRGYTRFTQEHGDEAAARLVEKFASLMREGVRARGGRVVELRGDEAFAVFGSARQALRAAIDLRSRFLEESQRDPELPLPVGIGIDAGEAVPVEEGYRGEALNLAARLCNLAGPWEVLASEGVVYLGRRVQGVTYAERGLVPLKGFADPVRVIRVVPEPGASAMTSGPFPASPGGSPDRLPLAGSLDTPVEAALPIGGFLGALPSGVLVGRDLEWGRVMAALEDVMQESGRFVLLSGEPGIGKTRLAQEVTLKARHWNFVIATGRCYEPEQAVPYYPFLEVLLTLYHACPAEVRADIPRRWPYLARLLPEEVGLLPPLAASPLAAQEDQQRLFRSVTGFLQAIAEYAPVALLLDDLHWADDSSLKLLQHLARYTRPDRIFLLGTYRNVEVHRQHPLETALLDLGREGLVEEVEVRRLDQAGTAALMAEIVGEKEDLSDLIEIVHRNTEGNAFFIQEVLRALMERGDIYRREDGRWERRKVREMEVPKSIRSVIGQRLSHLEEQAQEILREASVLGQTFTFEDLLALAMLAPPASSLAEGSEPGSTEDELERALEQAMLAGLLREAGDEVYAFNHSLVQQALYSELSTRRRKRLHLAAGRAIERLPERVRDRRTGELAYHFLEGDDAERALHYSLVAGDQAEAVYANGEAERHYRTALDLAREVGDVPCEIEALEKLARVVAIGARYNRALELLELAARLYVKQADDEGEARIVAQIGHLHYLRGTPKEGIERLRPLLEAREGRDTRDPSGLRPVHAPESGTRLRAPSLGTAALWAALARLYDGTGQYNEQLQAAERAIQLAQAIGDQPEATRLQLSAEVTWADALWTLGHSDDTLHVMEDLIARIEAAGDLDTLARALSNTADYYGRRGELEKDRLYTQRALEVSERRGDRGHIVLLSLALSTTAFLVGDWEAAQTHLERTESIMRPIDSFRLVVWPMTAHGWLAFRRGDLEAAEAAAGHVLSHVPAVESAWRRQAKRLLAEIELARGDARAAYEELQPCLEEKGWPRDQGFLRTLGLVELALDESAGGIQAAESARAHLNAAVEAARKRHDQPELVESLVAQAAALRNTDAEQARASLHEALAVSRTMLFPYGEAIALRDLASFEEGAERNRLLGEALAIFERLGANLDVERTREALAA